MLSFREYLSESNDSSLAALRKMRQDNARREADNRKRQAEYDKLRKQRERDRDRENRKRIATNRSSPTTSINKTRKTQTAAGKVAGQIVKSTAKTFNNIDHHVSGLAGNVVKHASTTVANHVINKLNTNR